MNGRFVRALVAFLALPGVVAFAVPLLAFGRAWPPVGVAWFGAGLLAIGCVVLAWTVHDFHVLGRGSLAPWAPPEHLVIAGLYRFSRNPMYISVLSIVWGWAVLFQSAPLALYAAGLLGLFHCRIVWGEEPWLARTHGASWEAYRRAVPRWVGLRKHQRLDEGLQSAHTRNDHGGLQ